MIDFKSYRTLGETLVIRVGGRLDEQSTEYFFDCVADAIEAGDTRIVINFGDLGHVSSRSLGELGRARARAVKSGGTIYLANIENHLLNLFNVALCNRLFKIYHTEDEAICAIESIETTAPLCVLDAKAVTKAKVETASKMATESKMESKPTSVTDASIAVAIEMSTVDG